MSKKMDVGPAVRAESGASAPLAISEILQFFGEWVEGFALTFVFADAVSSSRLDADVLYCARHAEAELVVSEVITAAARATRPLVLVFLGSEPRTMLSAIARLNERRTLLEKSGQPILLVCPAGAIVGVRNACPDLWHIRTVLPSTAVS